MDDGSCEPFAAEPASEHAASSASMPSVCGFDGSGVAERFCLDPSNAQFDIGEDELFASDVPFIQHSVVPADGPAPMSTDVVDAQLRKKNKTIDDIRLENRSLKRKLARRDKAVDDQKRDIAQLNETQDWSLAPRHDKKRTPMFRCMLVALKRNSGHASLRATRSMLGLRERPQTIASWETQCQTSILAEVRAITREREERFAGDNGIDTYATSARRYSCDAVNAKIHKGSSVQTCQIQNVWDFGCGNIGVAETWPDALVVPGKSGLATLDLTNKQSTSVLCPIFEEINGTSPTMHRGKSVVKWIVAVTDDGGDCKFTRTQVQESVKLVPYKLFLGLCCMQHSASNGHLVVVVAVVVVLVAIVVVVVVVVVVVLLVVEQ